MDDQVEQIKNILAIWDEQRAEVSAKASSAKVATETISQERELLEVPEERDQQFAAAACQDAMLSASISQRYITACEEELKYARRDVRKLETALKQQEHSREVQAGALRDVEAKLRQAIHAKDEETEKCVKLSAQLKAQSEPRQDSESRRLLEQEISDAKVRHRVLEELLEREGQVRRDQALELGQEIAELKMANKNCEEVQEDDNESKCFSKGWKGWDWYHAALQDAEDGLACAFRIKEEQATELVKARECSLELRSEVCSLQQELQEAVAQPIRDHTAQETTDYLASKFRAESAVIHNELRDVKARNEIFEAQMKNYHIQSDELLQIEQELRRGAEELATATTNSHDLQGELANSTKTSDDLRAELASVEHGARARTEAQTQKHHAEYAEQQTEIVSFEVELRDIKTKNDTTQKLVQEYHDELQDLKIELASKTKHSYDEAHEVRNQLAGELAQEALQKRLAQEAKERTATELATAEDKITNLTLKLIAFEEKIAKLESVVVLPGLQVVHKVEGGDYDEALQELTNEKRLLEEAKAEVDARAKSQAIEIRGSRPAKVLELESKNLVLEAQMRCLRQELQEARDQLTNEASVKEQQAVKLTKIQDEMSALQSAEVGQKPTSPLNEEGTLMNTKEYINEELKSLSQQMGELRNEAREHEAQMSSLNVEEENKASSLVCTFQLPWTNKALLEHNPSHHNANTEGLRDQVRQKESSPTAVRDPIRSRTPISSSPAAIRDEAHQPDAGTSASPTGPSHGPSVVSLMGNRSALQSGQGKSQVIAGESQVIATNSVLGKSQVLTRGMSPPRSLSPTWGGSPMPERWSGNSNWNSIKSVKFEDCPVPKNSADSFPVPVPKALQHASHRPFPFRYC